MKVKLLVSRAGANLSQSAGEVVDVSAIEAGRMIEAGQAVPYIEIKKETATQKRSIEKATRA